MLFFIKNIMEQLNISIKGKKNLLNESDYSLFNKPKGRGNNDKNNKQRELIIYAIVNSIITKEWNDKKEWKVMEEG